MLEKAGKPVVSAISRIENLGDIQKVLRMRVETNSKTESAWQIGTGQ